MPQFVATLLLLLFYFYLFFFFFVNVLFVAGTVGGGTPGHLIMGDGLSLKKILETCKSFELNL